MLVFFAAAVLAAWTLSRKAFLAALAYDWELSSDFLLVEGERERDDAGDSSLRSRKLLPENIELFLAKLAEESLRMVDAITGFIFHNLESLSVYWQTSLV